jgi:DNA-binding NarL/FixJ family response regulator
MIRVYVAGTLPEERSALRLVLMDLKMEVVGEASDWPTTKDHAPKTNLNMLLIDWNLLAPDPKIDLAALRVACPRPVVIVLIGYLDERKQAAISFGADAIINKNETPERVADRLRRAADNVVQ